MAKREYHKINLRQIIANNLEKYGNKTYHQVWYMFYGKDQEYRRKYRYHSDPEYRKKRVLQASNYSKKKEDESKVILFQKLGNKCRFCGNTNKTVLVIHHLNGQGKDKRPNKARIWREYLKSFEFNEPLILVCSNCHLLIHNGEIKVK